LEILTSRFPRYAKPGEEPSKNGYAAGFQLPNGRQIAVNTKGSEAMVWIERCDPLPPIDGVLVRNDKFPGQPYGESQPRKSSLNDSVAPRLKVGNAVYCLNITSEQAFLRLLSWYSGASE
jgi:hypothetical protein